MTFFISQVKAPTPFCHFDILGQAPSGSEDLASQGLFVYPGLEIFQNILPPHKYTVCHGLLRSYDKGMQDIDVHSETKKLVVTLLVMRGFLVLPGALRACMDFRDPTAFSRFMVEKVQMHSKDAADKQLATPGLSPAIPSWKFFETGLISFYALPNGKSAYRGNHPVGSKLDNVAFNQLIPILSCSNRRFFA